MNDVSHETERSAITDAVGQAIDQWSYVENALDWIVATMLRTERQRAHVVMATIINFKTRLQICNNLMEREAVSPETKATWNNLYNRINRQNDKRNEIAHFAIVDISEQGQRKGLFLVPYFKLSNETGTKRLTATDVLERADRFGSLGIELTMFMRELQREIDSVQAVQPQEADQGQAPYVPSGLTPKEI